MNVYDFDGTIYSGDSTLDFYLFSLRKRPWLVWTTVPNVVNGALFKLGFLGRQEFKERFFKLILLRVDVDALVAEFWDERSSRIMSWYLACRQANDLVISASPEFLLQPMAMQLGFSLIATKVDPTTGEFEGPNMRGEEKVTAFYKAFPDGEIDCFYTDDVSADAPLLRVAKRAFLVRGNEVTEIISPR